MAHHALRPKCPIAHICAYQYMKQYLDNSTCHTYSCRSFCSVIVWRPLHAAVETDGVCRVQRTEGAGPARCNMPKIHSGRQAGRARDLGRPGLKKNKQRLGGRERAGVEPLSTYTPQLAGIHPGRSFRLRVRVDGAVSGDATSCWIKAGAAEALATVRGVNFASCGR